MKFTIITINYNDQEGLEDTFKSVFAQTYQQFEYVVIDGGSSDGSKELIKKHADKLSYWVSEPDKGIYNAMNKGIEKATGEYLLFLNSGDSLYNIDVLKNVSEKIDEKISIYYGNVLRHYKDHSIIKKYPKKLSFSFFIDSALAHQAVFIKNNLFKKYFYYNEDFKILADWEFLIYAIVHKNESYSYLDLVVANYDMNGISSQPEGKEIMEIEREQTYQKYFPLFIDDYNSLLLKKTGSKVDKKVSRIKEARFSSFVLKTIVNLLDLILRIKRKIAKTFKK